MFEDAGKYQPDSPTATVRSTADTDNEFGSSTIFFSSSCSKPETPAHLLLSTLSSPFIQKRFLPLRVRTFIIFGHFVKLSFSLLIIVLNCRRKTRSNFIFCCSARMLGSLLSLLLVLESYLNKRILFKTTVLPSETTAQGNKDSHL